MRWLRICGEDEGEEGEGSGDCGKGDATTVGVVLMVLEIVELVPVITIVISPDSFVFVIVSGVFERRGELPGADADMIVGRKLSSVRVD